MNNDQEKQGAESMLETVATDLYYVWSRKMGTGKPPAWEELDPGEREAWREITVKARAVFTTASRDPSELVKKIFLWWGALLGGGMDNLLVVDYNRSSGTFSVRRQGDSVWMAAQTLPDAVLKLARDLLGTIQDRRQASARDAARWRKLLGEVPVGVAPPEGGAPTQPESAAPAAAEGEGGADVDE